ncbi:hypothetical protein BACI349Y_740015 [Bacillus sp. 349Y]|jgi:hypothetical protein|nr:hypothetical protein BACI349Y_740015 [Bacillus sp. 349Y]
MKWKGVVPSIPEQARMFMLACFLLAHFTISGGLTGQKSGMERFVPLFFWKNHLNDSFTYRHA